MNQDVKNAMMEFLEPGSSIQMDALLQGFAIMCNDTKRACFSITRNVKTKKWRVTLTGVRKSFIRENLRDAINDAGEFVFKNRIKQDGEFKIESKI